jgi:hypothetical protein
VIARLGFRLIPDLIFRIVGLAMMIGTFVLVASLASPLFAAFSMPLAAVNVRARLGVSHFAWFFDEIY